MAVGCTTTNFRITQMKVDNYTITTFTFFNVEIILQTILIYLFFFLNNIVFYSGQIHAP